MIQNLRVFTPGEKASTSGSDEPKPASSSSSSSGRMRPDFAAPVVSGRSAYVHFKISSRSVRMCGRPVLDVAVVLGSAP